MSTEIGNVNINLRMSLANLSSDVKAGNDAVRAGMDGIRQSAAAASREASGSLALIGEEIGVTIPRHLRTFITGLPGVGTALNAAFDSVAVIALISLMVEIGKHILELQKQAEEAAAAMKSFGDIGNDAAHKLDEEILALQQHIAELQGNSILALQLALEAVNDQKFDKLSAEFQKIGKEAADNFAKLKVTWFQNLLGSGNNDAVQDLSNQVTAVIAEVQKLSKAGDDEGISKVISAQLDKARTALDTFDSWGHGETQVKNALQGELSTLEALQVVYSKVKELSTDRAGIDAKQAETRAAEALNDQLKKMRDLVPVQNAPDTEITGGFSTQLTMALQFLDQWKSISSQILASTPAPKAPAQGFSKESLDQLRLQEDINEQYRRGQEIFTDTRTSAEKYANEMQVLNTLLASGAISQDTYNRAVTQAKERYDDLSKGLAQIGDTIGKDVAQAALFGGSWTKAFQDILAEVLKTIIQLTILKGLQDATASHGGGGGLGFLTSIVGGLTGHAGGGTVVAGHGYLVGENGPEPFFPTTAGTILPNESLRAGSGGPQTIVHAPEFHFHGIADADSFRKSQGQISAAMLAAMSRDASRNG